MERKYSRKGQDRREARILVLLSLAQPIRAPGRRLPSSPTAVTGIVSTLARQPYPFPCTCTLLALTPACLTSNTLLTYFRLLEPKTCPDLSLASALLRRTKQPLTAPRHSDHAHSLAETGRRVEAFVEKRNETGQEASTIPIAIACYPPAYQYRHSIRFVGHCHRWPSQLMAACDEKISQ